MKKIFTIVLVIVVLALAGCSSQEPEDTVMSLSEALKYIDEVAGMVDYYDHIHPEYPNLVKGPNEIQGQCGDYALLFALKTGASLIIVNQGIPEISNGVYKVAGKSNDLSYINIIEKSSPKDKNGDPVSSINWNGSEAHLYHPKIGLYRIRKVSNYTPKISNKHVWNLLGTTEIDVQIYDVSGTWQRQ